MSSDSSAVAKIAIKLGGAEFTAEGPADLVKEQFAAFMEAASRAAPTRPDGAPEARGGGSAEREEDHVDEITAQLIDRVYGDRGNTVSLKVLPKGGAADALLLLLYAFLNQRGEDEVTGAALAAAADLSGVQMGRLDRTIATRSEFITTSGVRRGKRYGLNNRGIKECERILAGILN